MKYNIAILKNELPHDHEMWIDSCQRNDRIRKVDIIELLDDKWHSQLQDKSYDAFLLKPSGIFSHLKQLYDERVIIISKNYKGLIYPSVEELLLYENKRYLRDWLAVKRFPHPKTYVFYSIIEAESFLSTLTNFPIVAKTNIGASGNGVKILKNHKEVWKYINQAFSKGIFTRTGPKLKKGSIIKKIDKALNQKGFILQRLKQYSDTLQNPQKNFVIFQEFIPHTFEWRCVRIGKSYFAHKKIAKNNMSSGTLLKGYDSVPISLLNFIKHITEDAGLSSVAIDLFEKDEKYLINEIQCIFGQSDPYQMLVDGRQGRYIWQDDKWKFEEGTFNSNQSYDLRVEHVISLLDENNWRNENI